MLPKDAASADQGGETAACVSRFLGRGEQAGPQPSHLPFQVCFQRFKTCPCKCLKSGVWLCESIRLNLGPDFKHGLVRARLSKTLPSPCLTSCLTSCLSNLSLLTLVEREQQGASSVVVIHRAQPRSPAASGKSPAGLPGTRASPHA